MGNAPIQQAGNRQQGQFDPLRGLASMMPANANMLAVAAAAAAAAAGDLSGAMVQGGDFNAPGAGGPPGSGANRERRRNRGGGRDNSRGGSQRPFNGPPHSRDSSYPGYENKRARY